MRPTRAAPIAASTRIDTIRSVALPVFIDVTMIEPSPTGEPKNSATTTPIRA